MNFPFLNKTADAGIGHKKSAIACTIWIGLIVVAYLSLLSYESRPGEVTNHQVKLWPEASRIKRATNSFTLVMFVHPKCPCSSASITELSVLMTRCRTMRSLQCYVVFLKPSSFPNGWEKGSLWQRAFGIPGVSVLSDNGGIEAELFGATVSGTTIVYSPSGELIFKGGITAGRGHEGDNQGLDAIAYLFNGDRCGALHDTPVFGCTLQDIPIQAMSR